jgi:hypothetical protein
MAAVCHALVVDRETIGFTRQVFPTIITASDHLVGAGAARRGQKEEPLGISFLPANPID